MKTLEEWVQSRPASVQSLYKEFPIGSTFGGPQGETWYLLRYTEDDMLIVSEINPAVDFQKAKRNQKYIHAHHYRTKQ